MTAPSRFVAYPPVIKIRANGAKPVQTGCQALLVLYLSRRQDLERTSCHQPALSVQGGVKYSLKDLSINQLHECGQ
ncbi:MAG: hypothetical protein KME27_07540 [Lyngbya sp. HA4199-MV5]|nr:hypothetical protein [Lyngbya sp. HA4199-MV5]